MKARTIKEHAAMLAGIGLAIEFIDEASKNWQENGPSMVTARFLKNGLIRLIEKMKEPHPDVEGAG